MLCQECQEKEASVHVTKIINNKKQELYFCKECAQATGELKFGSDFSFNNLLTGLLNSKPHSHHQINLSSKQLRCSNCDLSYQEFSHNGRLGCSQCYDYFGDKINKILRRIHSSNRHTGKIPKRIGENVRVKRKINNLKEEMGQAVAKEEFERAAVLRDEIKELEDRLDNRG
ncbi:UvrB/UvrC motif-containing protein [Natroniella sulfidigena]|uniref:UvrB/UvrC motif-containing protein n=1 Tax=Natroniella sulfidigena TaxID=723921 RepID=UPI00200B608E|nr:UvrB/UvrC motif-containing protein [Natroniella sulfidigena]MCK8816241.1 UvrB/UvrC motif-containing protein [Natroniella sulfidigena]